LKINIKKGKNIKIMSNFSRENTQRLYSTKRFSSANFGLETLLEHEGKLGALAGAGIGGALGASSGDEDDRLTRGLAGALAGAGVGYGGAKGARYLQGKLDKGLGEGIGKELVKEGDKGNWLGKALGSVAGLSGLGGGGYAANRYITEHPKESQGFIAKTLNNLRGKNYQIEHAEDIFKGTKLPNEEIGRGAAYVEKAKELYAQGKIGLSDLLGVIQGHLNISKDAVLDLLHLGDKPESIAIPASLSRSNRNTANFFINPYTIGAGVGGVAGAVTANPNATLGDRLGRGVVGAALGAGAGAGVGAGYKYLGGAGKQLAEQGAKAVNNGTGKVAMAAGAGGLVGGAAPHILDTVHNFGTGVFSKVHDHLQTNNINGLQDMQRVLGDHFGNVLNYVKTNYNNPIQALSSLHHEAGLALGKKASEAAENVAAATADHSRNYRNVSNFNKAELISKANYYSNPTYMADFGYSTKARTKYYRRSN
jgi:hypothetical protein